MESINIKKILINSFIVIIIFLLDRLSKIYILNLIDADKFTDIYINQYLNLTLIWNTGIGFGLFSLESNFYYNSMTAIIVLINIIIVIMIIKYKNYKSYLLLMVLGGSLGNLFDRLYYSAVPDFIDLHYNNFHWFIFNVADIFISLGILCLIFVELFLNNKRISN